MTSFAAGFQRNEGERLDDRNGNGQVRTILRVSGSSLTTVLTATNNDRIGVWYLDTSNNDFGSAADLDGDRSATTSCKEKAKFLSLFRGSFAGESQVDSLDRPYHWHSSNVPGTPCAGVFSGGRR